MQLWYGLDSKPLDYEQAARLLGDRTARVVARTILTTERGRIDVSTVFLVLDHGWDGGPPVLWETLIFNGPDDGTMRRYRSREAARAGHDEAVSFCRSALDVEGVAVIATETHEGPQP